MSLKRRPVRATILAGLMVCALALAAPASAGAAPSKAKRANDFVNSIGVNTHLGYTNTVYRRHDLVKAKLLRLGIRHIRDGAVYGQPFVHSTMRELAAGGIRLTMLVGDPLRRWGGRSLREQLALVKRELLPAVEALEGPNEYNNNARDLDPHWVATLRDYQARLYRQVNADPSLRRLPVLAPSVLGAGDQDAVGDLSRFADYGNAHPYPSGGPPESNMRFELHLAKKVARSRRPQATETGYHNAVNVFRGFGHRPASERAAGVYMPRLYMEYFRRGFARTFAYELMDQWPDPGRENNEARFGLLRNDFSEKPAFRSIRRLIALLRDPGPRFATRTLRYSIAGAPRDLHKMLLQKRDGSYYLALWRPVSVWDQNRIATLHPRRARVRVKLGRAAGVEVYRPSQSGRRLLRRSRVGSVRLRVSSSLTLVKIVPGARASRRACVSRRGFSRLRAAERRAVRGLLRLRQARPASARSRRRTGRVKRWLRRRASRIRQTARRSGWRRSDRRVRYRVIRRVLRASAKRC